MSTTLNVSTLKGAFILGAKRLYSQKDYINELNVFPVPDGDTGTNMSLTVNSALNDIESVDFDDPRDLCKAISQGSLRGARGNSGVILSQLFRGFYKVVKTNNNLDVETLAEALAKATETAYRAVMKPKEGTILTVAKSISDRALIACHETKEIEDFFDMLVEAASESLEETPELLPVLKQAGVVDSGGTGLLEILKGAADFISGRDTDLKTHVPKKEKKTEIIYTYEMSFTLLNGADINNKIRSEFESYIMSLGKLESVNEKDGDLSIKLKTDAPGKLLSKALKISAIDKAKVKNIAPAKIDKDINQVEPPKTDPEEFKEMGFVSVSVGEGIESIFSELGVDYCIKGGQTMNPSTEDILEAVSKVNAKSVFVLPNNKNILLAAEQAAKLCEDKKIYVIPTKTIPQGICALINFIPEKSPEENKETMCQEIEIIRSGEITHAVRDTEIDDKVIKKDDYMGIGDAGIVSVDKNMTKCMEKLIGEISDEDSSLISIYYGMDVSETDAQKMAKHLEKKFSHMEIDLQMGGQPVYYYIVSVE